MTSYLYVVALGNQFDGTRLFGPFVTFEEADKFAGSVNDEWRIVELEDPDKTQ